MKTKRLPKTIRFRITRADVVRANRARRKPGYDVFQDCLMGQVLKRKFPREALWCAIGRHYIGSNHYFSEEVGEQVLAWTAGDAVKLGTYTLHRQ